MEVSYLRDMVSSSSSLPVSESNACLRQTQHLTHSSYTPSPHLQNGLSRDYGAFCCSLSLFSMHAGTQYGQARLCYVVEAVACICGVMNGPPQTLRVRIRPKMKRRSPSASVYPQVNIYTSLTTDITKSTHRVHRKIPAERCSLGT